MLERSNTFIHVPNTCLYSQISVLTLDLNPCARLVARLVASRATCPPIGTATGPGGRRPCVGPFLRPQVSVARPERRAGLAAAARVGAALLGGLPSGAGRAAFHGGCFRPLLLQGLRL